MGGISRYEKIALGATAIFVVLCLLLLIRPGKCFTAEIIYHTPHRI